MALAKVNHCGRQHLELKRINDRVSVSGQISPDDVDAIKAAGFVAIVNNRPDGEAGDQPTSAELEKAAVAAGLVYIAIPVGREGVSDAMVQNTRAAMDNNDGPVLFFCRTGTRSTTLWALSQAGKMDAKSIISAAANAGYDMSHLAGHL